jgi:molybdopterin molybdotransferase
VDAVREATTAFKTVDEHLSDILAVVQAPPPMTVQLLDAHGLLLAEDVSAPEALPRFDNSSMDGYAVRLADLAGVTRQHPATLRVIADIPAGSTSDVTLTSGTCARVMTGAPVPEGAEAVVPVEWTDAGTATVRVHQPAEAGAYIRRVGEDIAVGEVLLRRGVRLGARQTALLAGIGRDRVAVRARPRVVIISTGSELVEPGTAPGPGQITDSNSFMLAAAVRDAGGIAYRHGIVPDDPRALLDVLDDQLVRADLVITSGGVSVGAYDVVKEVLSQLGTVTFDRVAMQPGMPQGFGTLGPDRVPIFTLPGNPASSYVAFEIFVRPAIRVMLGHPEPHQPTLVARCAVGFTSPAGRRQFLRGALELDDAGAARGVRPVGGSGSHLLGGLARADCLIVVPEDVTTVRPGDRLDVIPLGER